jgi:protein-S-isoprenylcysteine O-methyltransferase Ste14
MGAVLIVMNNIWTSGLSLLITILGWLTLIKGAFLLLFPNLALSLYRKFNKDSVLMAGGIVAFILGLVLLYLGFM